MPEEGEGLITAGDGEGLMDSSAMTVARSTTITKKMLLSGLQLLVGIVLTITMIVLLSLPYYYYQVPLYCVGLYVGLYLTLKFIVGVVSVRTKGSLRVALVDLDRSITIPLSQRWMSFSLDLLFAFAMILTFSLVEPYWWTAGHIIGIIMAVLLIMKALLSMCKISVNDVYFTLPRDALAVPDHLTAAAKGIQEAWIGFAEEDTVRDIMKGRRVANSILLLVSLLLSLLVVVAEVALIRKWDTYNNVVNHAIFYISGGLGYGIPTSLHYYAGISAGGAIILICLLVGGIFKVCWYTNLLIGSLTLGAGVYMSLLSTYSVQSLMLLAKMSFDETAARCLHLMPIPLLAVILLAFGMSTLAVNFRLEETSAGLCKRVLQVMLYSSLTGISLASLTYSQLFAMEAVQTLWTKPYEAWRDVAPFTLYIAAETSLAMMLLVLALVKLLSGRRQLPRLISWVFSAILFSLAVFTAYALFGEDSVLEKADIGILTVNGVLVAAGGGYGLVGMAYYGPAIIELLALVFRLLSFLILCLCYLFVFLVKNIPQPQSEESEVSALEGEDAPILEEKEVEDSSKLCVFDEIKETVREEVEKADRTEETNNVVQNI